MGSSSASRSNLLAKNWIRVNNLTYRNVTTNELISEYRIQYQSDEQLSAGTRLLMKRANINHPNVVKLIYFCQDNAKGSCRGSAYSHRLYLEHCQINLHHLITTHSSPNQKQQCLCCSIINGLLFLAQTYGFFLVEQQMIWVNEHTQNKNSQKRTAKVWINAQLNRSQCEVLCSEQKMCQRISDIYTKIFEHRICTNPWIKQIGQFKSLQQILNFIFQVHQTSPQLTGKHSKTGHKLNQQQQQMKAREQQSQQNLQRPANRSYSAYVKQQNLARRDSSVMISNNFTISSRKMVPATSEVYFRNVNRPTSPSPSIKINFLFANNQQINNTHKPNFFLPAQTTRPESNSTNNYIQNSQRLPNQNQPRGQQLKSNQNQPNTVKKQIDTKDELKKEQQKMSQHQKSVPDQSNLSASNQQSSKQSESRQIKNQYIAQVLSQKQIAREQIPVQKFTNVFQQHKITNPAVSQFNLQQQKQTKLNSPQKHHRQQLNLTGQLNKTSTISKTYPAKLQKTQPNSQDINYNDYPSNTHKQSNHFNEPNNPKRHQRSTSYQGNIEVDAECQSLQSAKVQQQQLVGRELGWQIEPKLANSKQVRQRRKKLQKIQLQKDLQHEKEMIKKEMALLLKSNMMTDDSNKIKERVNNKKATFAELKAEAAKILDGFGF